MVYNLKAMVFVCFLEGHKSNVYSIATNFDDTIVYSGSTDKTLRVWNMFD